MEPLNVGDTSRLAIGRRLRWTRLAMGYDLANRFAEHCRLGYTTYNNYETGINRPNYDQAMQIVVATGVSLDWIYRGLDGLLPAYLRDAIAEIRAQEEEHNPPNLNNSNGGKPRKRRA
jgi:transcriptional regulator with XRE-family HTH domain